jgi:hypothetical protein
MSRFVKEPPKPAFGKYERKPPAEHAKWANAMKRRPLEWMLVRECTSIPAAARLAQAIKTSRYLAFRDGTYEARIGKHGGHTDPNQRAVYARYMGPL